MRGLLIGFLVAAAACKKDRAAPPAVESPRDKPALVWVGEAGHGGEEAVQVSIDSTGAVFYASRLRDAQNVEGKSRPSKTHDDAIYVAARDIEARNGWARTAASRISYPHIGALAGLGGGRLAVVIDARHQVVDWGKGMINPAAPPTRDGGDLEQFRAASDAIPQLGLAVYVIGETADDVTIVQAARGEAKHVVSDGAGAIVVAGTGFTDDLDPRWRQADAAACQGQLSLTIARWRDASTPDWAACVPIEGEPRITDLALAADGDVLACIDVDATANEDSTGPWHARLLRLDGATGKTLWSVALSEHDGQSGCDGLATTGDGHVVLGQEDVKELVVFAGKAAPSLDAPTKIRARSITRGLRPRTIVSTSSDGIQEIDVVSGAVLWSYPIPSNLNVDEIAAGAGMVAIGGSYDESFDGGPAGRLRAPGDDDLAGFVMVVRAPITP